MWGSSSGVQAGGGRGIRAPLHGEKWRSGTGSGLTWGWLSLRAQAPVFLGWASVIETSSCEGVPDAVGVSDGAHHDGRDKRSSAVLESAGALRVARLME